MGALFLLFDLDEHHSLQTMLPTTGTVHVQPGNTINIAFGDDPAASRQIGFQIAEALIAANPKGFDVKKNMRLVVPRPTFKKKPQKTPTGLADETTAIEASPSEPGAHTSENPLKREHNRDTGLHVTVAMDGNVPWKDERGQPDIITDDMIEQIAGRKIELTVDTNQWYYLEGSEENDEATGAVFYLAAFLDDDSQSKVADIRRELGFGKVNKIPHLTLAGVAPENGNFSEFRKRFCRPSPVAPGATKEPYKTLIEMPSLP